MFSFSTVKLNHSGVSTYCVLPDLPIVHQMMLCFGGDGISQSLLQDRSDKEFIFIQ